MEKRLWLLLLHQIPPKPAYFRAKVLRRLARVGALPIKNSAYLLPDNEDTLEDLEWIAKEIQQQGGAAWLFRAESLAGMSANQIEEAFRQLHADEYENILDQARSLLQQPPSEETSGIYRTLSRRAEKLRQIDFFEHRLRQEMERIMTLIEAHLHPETTPDSLSVPTKPGRVWVTRKGVRVDRMASAWLIRRFIDPAATFRFVDPQRDSHQTEEIRFDMFEGEFTHQGDSCTFEVLLSAHNLQADTSLMAIAEIVHDIDLKDDRYQRPEIAGVAKLIDGVCVQTQSDELRLERGGLIFESLYQSFS
jgi:hypothetical protein